MTTPDRELPLEEVPGPPLYRLVDGSGAPVLEHAEIGGEAGEEGLVGVIFASPDLAREFSEEAGGLGFSALAGLSPEEAPAGGGYPLPGAGYVLVVSERGTGLFHAEDLAARLAPVPGPGAPGTASLSFPLYLISDEAGESPLISVADEEAGEEGLLVAALFTSPELAGDFRRRAGHLGLPGSLGTIEDADGLRRHALVAQKAGARYVVVDPEAGETDALPVEELIRYPYGP
ncbi:hypothetical protein [Rubrobacter aplysinae]|uniref:hypothetical protein n=1 Tax=Rubrobacter aplysinae TaxID=909625 RepID=UPI00064C11FB|nr:hypothetical protein [Rubrobacter aplysinae]